MIDITCVEKTTHLSFFQKSFWQSFHSLISSMAENCSFFPLPNIGLNTIVKKILLFALLLLGILCSWGLMESLSSAA